MLEKFYDFSWYKIPAKYQKSIAHLIHRRQHAGVIKMGPFDVLNYETSSQAIYFF